MDFKQLSPVRLASKISLVFAVGTFLSYLVSMNLYTAISNMQEVKSRISFESSCDSMGEAIVALAVLSSSFGDEPVMRVEDFCECSLQQWRTQDSRQKTPCNFVSGVYILPPGMLSIYANKDSILHFTVYQLPNNLTQWNLLSINCYHGDNPVPVSMMPAPLNLEQFKSGFDSQLLQQTVDAFFARPQYHIRSGYSTRVKLDKEVFLMQGEQPSMHNSYLKATTSQTKFESIGGHTQIQIFYADDNFMLFKQYTQWRLWPLVNSLATFLLSAERLINVISRVTSPK